MFMDYLELITEIRNIVADDLPTHPSALLSTRQLAKLAGIAYPTLQKRLPAWEANGLKVLRETYGGKLRPYAVRLSDWNAFIDKSIKKDTPI